MDSPSLGTCPGLDEAFMLAHQNFPQGGTILEFGVAGGYSYAWMAWQIVHLHPQSRLIGFDSWQGLPAETEGVWRPECHRQGNYRYDDFWVVKMAESFGLNIIGDPRFSFVSGFYKDTLNVPCYDLIPKKDVILINMDVDLHSSAVLVLEWITPLLKPGMLINTDDWLFPMFPGSPDRCGVSLAFEQWQERHPSIKLRTMKIQYNSQRYFEVQAV